METKLNNLETRVNVLHSVLTKKSDQNAVTNALLEAKGDWTVARANLKDKLSESLKTLDLAYTLADVFGDNIQVVKVLANSPEISSLRDVALRFNAEKLAALVDPATVPDATPGTTPEEKQRNFALSLHNNLFLTETSAVLQRMARDAELPVAEATVRSNVVTFFGNVPDFNIRTTSIYKALQKPEVFFKNIPDEQRADTVAQLKILQRVQALSPGPDVLQAMMKLNLTAASQVAGIPESTFLKSYTVALGGEANARHVYTTAINIHIRNENALMTMRESLRGSGMAIIDGPATRETRVALAQKVADAQGVPVNLETLFGETDYCECDEGLSVSSPAQYLVEALNYLRNNNLGPDPKNPNPNPETNPNPGIRADPKDISNTPLEKLFRRRPDLGCLELTSENTFTVLPYIDLVNEVMESFVAHYHGVERLPEQLQLEVFNVMAETSGELLAQPQHINYEAYCILKNAVFPFTLPYHQPIDAIRIFLKYLGTSRYELLDVYRTATDYSADATSFTSDEMAELQTLHETVLTRAVDAEFLGVTQEEYIILTKEAFWPKRYFEITLKQPAISDRDYQDNIGVKRVCEYYGYSGVTCESEMDSLDETDQKGLTFVKNQFLKRTGLQYVDLVELLKTRFINPNYLQGKAQTIFESVRFSYRFLQGLVDANSQDVRERFAKLIDFLNSDQPLVPTISDLDGWIYCYFDRIGKTIVLDAGGGPQLPIEGQIIKEESNPPTRQQIGTLLRDGRILDMNGAALGYVSLTIGKFREDSPAIIDQNGNKLGYASTSDRERMADGAALPVAGPVVWTSPFPGGVLSIERNDVFQGMIGHDFLWGPYENTLLWSLAGDTCDLDRVCLVHLDGTPLTIDEYDRIHRFIRLWRKLGWTIDELDKALAGVRKQRRAGTRAGAGAGAGAGVTTEAGTVATRGFVGFDQFKEDCGIPDEETGGGHSVEPEQPGGDWLCPDPIEGIAWDITVDSLHQLVAIRKLMDQTGLPLSKLLTLWSDISTTGDKSLYSTLFLTHNLIAMDKVFQADENGNYLTQRAVIAEHIPVLMAAFKLKADDIAAVTCKLNDDALTLANISEIYRHSLLARLLHVKVSELGDVIELFSDPFVSPQATLELLDTWGKMEDAGFTFRQLNYIIKNRDDPLRPLAPSQKTILQISRTLYDGLNSIDRDHPDIPEDKKEQATDDLIRSKAGLLFDPSVVEKIIGLLDGTTVYMTYAPGGQTINIPEPLAKKLKYSNREDAGSIQVTGILTKEESDQAKSRCGASDWPDAIDRVTQQAKNIFNEALTGIFPNTDEAIAQLLAGDVNTFNDPQDLRNTSSIKRAYFLKFFLPFLRQRLAHRLIVDAMSGAVGLAPDITDILLSDILLVGTPSQAAIDALKGIKDNPPGSPAGWKGYLIPPANEAYTFISTTGDTKPLPLVVDGQTIGFEVRQQEAPSNSWWYTDPATPVTLKAGHLYRLELSDRSADSLQWKTASSSNAAIPSSALLPDFSKEGTEEVFIKLYKSALLINGLSLDADEVGYLQGHWADFDGFDFNAVSLQHWTRLQAYADLRNSLPRTDTRLLDLFRWDPKPDEPDTLITKIAAATLWKAENIEKLLSADHFDLTDPANFRNEVKLAKLSKALEVAGKIGVDIDRLFDWAKPGSRFWECHQAAESIRNAIHARFNEDDWEQVVKPLNDQLRENQKQALISYLLVQQDLIDWGVVDADSLFEFFLIDVQMGACMETSRIKQAISSVQLFIQRCMLGLEEKSDDAGEQIGVSHDVLDHDRWEWMKNFRVWEANRKVFLYPHNLFDYGLRDDKSPFFKELESELLQKDISSQNVQDALKNYLYKVDEVAHLQVVGLFLEQKKDSNGNNVPERLHVFGRTHNAPYFFYYRNYDAQEKNWYPWEKMQVDIPSYDVTNDAFGHVTRNGTYLAPVVLKKRLLVFFPQISIKTRPKSTSTGNTIHGTVSNGEFSADDNTPITYSEIKLAWSEYRNGKWTQKQLSKDSVIREKVGVQGIHLYAFVPVIRDNKITINVLSKRDPGQEPDLNDEYQNIGAFDFVGSELYKEDSSKRNILMQEQPDSFHYFNDYPKHLFVALRQRVPGMPEEMSTLPVLRGGSIYSLQLTDEGNTPDLISHEPYFHSPDASQHQFFVHFFGERHNFHHPYTQDLLGRVNSDNLDTLFGYYQGPNAAQVDMGEAFGDDTKSAYHELKRSYSLYNWELGFHSIMHLVDRLFKAQQFDQALNMIRYILDPLAKGTEANRFWQFPPFKEIDASKTLERLFLGLQPDQSDDHINEWRNKPFQPHVVARSRPSAYMEYVAMKYIEILIAQGDHYFRQFTLETIPLAIQCYVLASHIYGPPGQKIPKLGKVQPQTYMSLLDKWDAFGNAMVELELVFPYSSQTPLPFGASNGVIGLANIFGFASTLYFCIPDNPQLKALRNTIDDRLFKIRHCQDIEGVYRHLPLFEPPIEPGLLVQAAAQGLSLSSVLNDLSSPMPNYRFYYLLQKAFELCSEVKALGNAFLSAKEKGDAEALSQLRARHETSIHNLVVEVKKLQLDESQKSLDALQQSRLGPKSRMEYYLKLIGDQGKAPEANSEFTELPNQIEQPIDESGLKLIQYEKEEMDKADASRRLQIGIGLVETLASEMNMIPGFSTHLQPFGPGTSISFGGSNLGAYCQAIARALQIDSNGLSYQSTNAGRKAGFLRQLQDRVQQANAAGYEIKHIDKQILAQQIRISIANQEITNQQQQIDNAKEVEDFLRNKYTNQELYSWMEGQIRTLYYQAYTLAYDLAKRAEKVFRFERGLNSDATNFIQFGYWNTGYDGLLAGERLYVGLKQLEAAYQEERGHDFEITKTISLRQINPLALIQLKETHSCEFALPEVLFDMDYPGHYLRRIKSIAMTIPCVIGPYTGVSCTLRLLEHKFRTKASVQGGYPERIDGTEDRFSTVNVPITSIATSNGQNDSGLHDLNFRDERYLPFEGAGVICKLRFELPAALPQFDYDSITDIAIHLRYTAVDGGDNLKGAATGFVKEYIKSVGELSRDEGLFALFDLRHDFPNEWHKAMHVSSGASERVMALGNLADRLPVFAKCWDAKQIKATDVYLFTPSALSSSALKITTASGYMSFADGGAVGELKSYVSHDGGQFSGWQLQVSDLKTPLDKLWMIVRYSLL